MLTAFVRAFQTPDLRKKLLITLGLRAEPNRDKPGTHDTSRLADAERVTPKGPQGAR